MGRRTARKHTFFIVYQFEFHKDNNFMQICENYIEDEPNIPKKEIDFIKQQACGVLEKLSEIDELIKTHSISWELERISKVDLAIMRLAIFEMIFSKDIPVGVSINEAVEIAKVFGDDESPAFINGILGKIATKLSLEQPLE